MANPRRPATLIFREVAANLKRCSYWKNSDAARTYSIFSKRIFYKSSTLCTSQTSTPTIKDNSKKYPCFVSKRLFSTGNGNCMSHRKTEWTWKETRYNGLILDLEEILAKQEKDSFVADLSGLLLT